MLPPDVLSTLASIVSASRQLALVAADAEARGLIVSDLIGAGGFSLVFEAQNDAGACALKIPWLCPSEPAGPRRVVRDVDRVRLVSVRDQPDAVELLRASCDRQNGHPSEVLPALIAHTLLGGVDVALLERIRGPNLAQRMPMTPSDAVEAMRKTACAVQSLHRSFGPHGDLQPSHVMIPDAEGPARLLDPLCHPNWVGTNRYTLGRSDARQLADLGALVAMTAELFGGDVRWSTTRAEQIASGVADASMRAALGVDLERGLTRVPRKLRQWAMDAGKTYLDAMFDDQIAPDCRSIIDALAG